MTTFKIIDEVNKIKEIDQFIQRKLLSNDVKGIEEAIDQYGKYTDTLSLYTLKANYYFQINDLNQAKEVVFQGLRKFPYNFEINFNAAVVLEVLGEYLECLTYYINSLKYHKNEEEKLMATNKCDEIIEILTNDTIYNKSLEKKIADIKELLIEGNNCSYPINRRGQSLIRQVLFKNTKEEFLINMYRPQNSEINVDNNTRYQFKSELIKGKELVGKYTIEIKGPSVIPISIQQRSTELTFSFNNADYTFPINSLKLNQFNYLRFEESGLLEINSNKNFFMGHPINLIDEVNISPRLVLFINIDGVSNAFLKEKNLKVIMPNTFKFFNRGYISDNCYANSEWTLPSNGTTFTGKYTANHGLFHPHFHYDLSERNKLMQEYFKEADYFTTQICNNWRITPTYGYYKGFDRIVYQNFMGGFGCGEVMAETVEHLETFKKKNHFMWISLTDLHDVGDGIENDLFSQVHTNIRSRMNKIEESDKKSVSLSFDQNKIDKYENELKRLDIHLGTLYNYINQNFAKDEILVVLNSDHGQTFLEEDSFILHESRRNVPLMLYGKGVNTISSEAIVNNIDVLPTLLHLCNIDVPSNIDGRVIYDLGGSKQNDYAFTEVLFPNKPYRAVISDHTHIFRFITEKNTENDGRVNISEYKIALINKNTHIDESDKYKDKVTQWLKIIFMHIKDHINL